jgi:hypothetical protein
MNITRTSVLTGATKTIFIEGLTQEMLNRYYGGELIQEAMPKVPVEFREFIMSGISPEEWNETMPPDEDELHPGECMLDWEDK